MVNQLKFLKSKYTVYCIILMLIFMNYVTFKDTILLSKRYHAIPSITSMKNLVINNRYFTELRDSDIEIDWEEADYKVTSEETGQTANTHSYELQKWFGECSVVCKDIQIRKNTFHMTAAEEAYAEKSLSLMQQVREAIIDIEHVGFEETEEKVIALLFELQKLS